MADTATGSGALTLKIVTPDRVVLDQRVDQVIAKAIDGEFAILPNHAPMITALAIDIVRYSSKGQEEHSAAVLGGLLEVGENVVTILSDTAELDIEIDDAKAKEALQKAEAEKTQRTDKLDVQLTEMALSRATARLKAIELSKRRRTGRQV